MLFSRSVERGNHELGSFWWLPSPTPLRLRAARGSRLGDTRANVGRSEHGARTLSSGGATPRLQRRQDRLGANPCHETEQLCHESVQILNTFSFPLEVSGHFRPEAYQGI